jgi:formylglycine-generating enzyme required for sulfatase activity
MVDLRFARRLVWKSSHFATVAAVTLALGGNRGVSLAAEASNPGGNFPGKKPGDEKTIGGVRVCWCPPGRFIMGSPRDEPERRPGEDQIEVTLSKGFWTAKFEATQGDWKRVIGKLPGPLTAELPEGDDYPVGNVNFAEAEGFCRKLTELARQSGQLPNNCEFRLPTEAQWEYACRAGTTTATSFGDRLSSKQANFKGKPYNGAEPGPSLGRAAKVGSYPANAWGLHDMHGNVAEWCIDHYDAKFYGTLSLDKPSLLPFKAPSEKRYSYVVRGGSWIDAPERCRSAERANSIPDWQKKDPQIPQSIFWNNADWVGFRVVRAVEEHETLKDVKSKITKQSPN